MGKEEKMLEELIEKVSALGDKLTNMEFLMVQGMGTGGSSPTSITPNSPTATGVGLVEVDLAPLENRIAQLEASISNIMNSINTLSDLTSNLSTEKTQKADELITQATSLLEKGLQLTELETTMLELKDRIEEIIIQLEVSNVGSSTTESS
ncbi:MAG: hypothetical protein ACW964_19700 [Candidatus Hodarchaeales archaeon]|jgi:hypothetical protein